jgi:hypothetical protein
MPDTVGTLLAALVGAVIGSVGAVVIQWWLSARTERSRQREELVQRYLYQLQDSVESLWYRLVNLAKRSGRGVMEDDYFAKSSLYSLGRVLALERILMLEGVYPQLQRVNPGMGEFLKTHRLDERLTSVLYQYDRLVLAEAVMEREGPHFRTSTYLEFTARYATREEEARDPFRLVLVALARLGGEEPEPDHTWEGYRPLAGDQATEALKSAMEMLRTVAGRLAEETGIPTTLSAQGEEQTRLQSGATWTARTGPTDTHTARQRHR